MVSTLNNVQWGRTVNVFDGRERLTFFCCESSVFFWVSFLSESFLFLSVRGFCFQVLFFWVSGVKSVTGAGTQSLYDRGEKVSVESSPSNNLTQPVHQHHSAPLANTHFQTGICAGTCNEAAVAQSSAPRSIQTTKVWPVNQTSGL